MGQNLARCKSFFVHMLLLQPSTDHQTMTQILSTNLAVLLQLYVKMHLHKLTLLLQETLCTRHQMDRSYWPGYMVLQ